MNVVGVIPARYASSRFPGKPLCMIEGKSMIRRVYEQAKKCTALSRVIVATDSDSILHHVEEFGGEVLLTRTDHKSGTERCAEVSRYLYEHTGSNPFSYDAVINIQGDEPLIHPEQIDLVASAFHDPEIQICTLVRSIDEPEDITNPNVVKVVFDHAHKALYFSRSPIPYIRNENPGNWFLAGRFFSHIGIYGYRADTLMELVTLPETSLEKEESLEQLRWLQHGFSIHIRETSHRTIGVDTPEDLRKIINSITH